MKVLSIVIIALMAVFALHAEEKGECPLCVSIVNIEGEEVSLDMFIGDVVLAVNTASKCGFTHQYGPLQSIYEKYSPHGFVVLGFPCNQFMEQEPGTEEEIMQFCSVEYGVTFPMFSKIDVNGENAHPLYAYLTSNNLPIEDQGPIKWNFEKFLFDRDGQVIARFRTRTEPDSEEVIEAIEAALGLSSEETE